MIRRPPRSTLDRSSAASDVYKRQVEPRREPHVGVVRETHRLFAVAIAMHHQDGQEHLLLPERVRDIRLGEDRHYVMATTEHPFRGLLAAAPELGATALD